MKRIRKTTLFIAIACLALGAYAQTDAPKGTVQTQQKEMMADMMQVMMDRMPAPAVK